MDTRLTKSYYKIREVAEYLDVPQSTLRFWEKEFPEVQPRRSSGNQRFYTPSDIETLQIIQYMLHVKGMKVEAVKEQMKHNKKNVSKKLTILNKLTKVRGDLELLLQSLNLRKEKAGIQEEGS